MKKLLFEKGSIWGVILVSTATILCAVIDWLLDEEEKL